MSQHVWHSIDLSLLNGYECRALLKMCSPSPVMLTSLHEWKILEWGETRRTNKQTNKQTNKLQDLSGRHMIPLHQRMHFANFSWNWHTLSMKLVYLKSVIMVLLSAFENGETLAINLSKFEFQWFKDVLCKFGLKSVVLEKKIFENRQCTCVFSYCCFYLLYEKSVALHSTNLKAYSPRMLWSKLGWIWPNGFEEIKNVKICRQVVGHTTDNSSLEFSSQASWKGKQLSWVNNENIRLKYF